MTDPSIWQFLETYYEGRIDKSILAEGVYEISSCKACGFVWQAWVLSEDAMPLLYGKWICSKKSLEKKKFADAALFQSYANQAAAISTLVAKPPHQTSVLDFGMGWGHWANMCKAFGYNVKGIELSHERVQYAKDMGLEVLDSLDDVNQFKFDFINSEQVFEHITEPLATLQHLCESLNEQGVIRIAVPDGAAALKPIGQPGWKAGKDALHPLEHVNCFTHTTLKQLGTAAGLDFIERPFPVRVNDRRETFLNLVAALTGRRRSRGTSLYFRKPATTAPLHRS
jgi:SAM-dependent methyltransferase